MMPVAWELLLETDQELAAAAGNSIFFIAGEEVTSENYDLEVPAQKSFTLSV